MNIVRHKEYLAYTGKERIQLNLCHIKWVRISARYVVEYGRLPTEEEFIRDWIDQVQLFRKTETTRGYFYTREIHKLAVSNPLAYEP